jgi:hypothetical protein
MAKQQQPHDPPTTLGNMREEGVHNLIAFCSMMHVGTSRGGLGGRRSVIITTQSMIVKKAGPREV